MNDSESEKGVGKRNWPWKEIVSCVGSYISNERIGVLGDVKPKVREVSVQEAMGV